MAVTARNQQNFMYYVQQHERIWGRLHYNGRPSLSDLLRAPVVVFWMPADALSETHFTATTHADLRELRKYVARLVVHSAVQMPTQRVVSIFVQRRFVRIAGVRLMLEEE